ncbi:MAG TPA: MaoC/PaaZ C-terminal domain-containing protein [Actinoplanes sp.]|nr:MaoC/PaaZ C-terminal domain-containing protein [Actinoplanes sp.]
MVAVVEVSDGSGTGVAYARAALGLLPGLRPTGTGALPGVEILHRGVVADRAHLAAYNRVCGFRVSDVLPATYPHVLAFPLAMRLMTGPGFPLPLIGLIHITNRITVHQRLDAAVPLDLTVRAADLRDHPRGRRFDITTTATAGGATVWSEVSTYLRLGPAPASGSDPASRPATGVADPAPAGSVWRIPARTGTDYAAVSGDRNPIHTSLLGARLFGFPRPIAHGMWSAARCLAALEGRLPDAFTMEVAFKKAILLPATVEFRTTGDDASRSFAVRSGHPHLTGTITEPDRRDR